MKAAYSLLAALTLTAIVASEALAAPQLPPTTSGTTSGSTAPVSAGTAPAAPAGTKAGAAPAEPAPQTVKTPLKAPAKPAAKPPEKVGFARVDPSWPKWLSLTLVDRMRVDSVPLPGAVAGPYDSYFINRFRVTAGVRFSSWAQATVQAQDARVAAYEVTPAKSIQNPFDLRLANVEFRRKAPRGAGIVVGRQELTFADGRLMASPDWGNVSRTYDGARFAAFAPGFKVEVFAAAPVDVNLSFSRAKYGERVAGAWTTFDRVKPLAYVEVYELVKHNHVATGETGSKGEQRVYATGLRAGGPIGKTITWEGDYINEQGHSAADSISAWAMHAATWWSVGKSSWKPKVGAEFDYASGDQNPKDGVKQTFDQMYASTHGKWGLADIVGWRNMQHVGVKLEVSPTKRLKVTTALNRQFLATVKDAWYGVSGAKLVTNRAATSRDLGWEPDLFGTYSLTRDITVGAGYAVLLGGDFVRQSTKVKNIRTPYLMWTLKF